MHKAISSFQKDICKSDHIDVETAFKAASILSTSEVICPYQELLPYSQCLSSEHRKNTLGNIFSKAWKF